MFCTCARSCARADDAKIVRSRNAQCKTRNFSSVNGVQVVLLEFVIVFCLESKALVSKPFTSIEKTLGSLGFKG